ncbi:hypothetical protein [Nodosilinea sp. E11]|uniref:hypothetical protein n=1 Tax=Nodosilinea sp. E11 TaxID=3037479 RepID=UPI0029346E12|nr:hypothetical protein [Nodosilinea sp. E11]WOD40573.1 hypothetical protein RRF56_07180 [Nodosilinea sp. E11]
MSDRNEEDVPEKNSFTEKAIHFLYGREFLIPLTLSAFFIVLASGTQLNILGSEIKPGESTLEKGILLAVAIACLLATAWMFTKNKQGSTESTRKHPTAFDQESLISVQEIKAKNSNTNVELFQGIDRNLRGIGNQKIVARSLSEWLNAKKEKERWAEKATLITLSMYRDFIPVSKDKEIQQDMESYLNIICLSLKTGERPRLRKSRALEEKTPYEGLLNFLEQEILKSYDSSNEIGIVLQDNKETARRYLTHFISELKNDLNRL